MMTGPKTLADTIYAMPFPSHEDVCELILALPDKSPWILKSDSVMFMWYAEMGSRQYSGMKRIFESKGDATIIKKVGGSSHAQGEPGGGGSTNEMSSCTQVHIRRE